MLIGDGLGVMLLERERGRWRRQTIGIGGCLNEDEAEKVEKADFVATTLKQVLRSIKARYYLPGCSLFIYYLKFRGLPTRLVTVSIFSSYAHKSVVTGFTAGDP